MTRINEKYQRVGYGLVRDKATGKPKVDNPDDLHPMHLMQMTAEERADLGVHADCWARDAQGMKRMTKTGIGKYRSEEPLVAVSEVFDVHTGDVWRLDQRLDAGAETTIHVSTAER